MKAKRFKAVARDNARYMEIPFTWPTMLFNNPKVEERVNEIKNRFPGQLSFYGISTLHGGYGAMTFQMNKQYVFDQVESGNFHKFKESTKFGRKFKESIDDELVDTFDTYDEFEALGDELEAKYKKCKYAEAEMYVDDDGSYTIAVRIDTDHKDESKEMNRFLVQQSRKHHWRLEKEPNIYDSVRERRVDEFYLYVI